MFYEAEFWVAVAFIILMARCCAYVWAFIVPC